MGNVFSNTDIRGRTDDSLTTEYVWNLGKALAEWLPEGGDVVIARGTGANEQTVHALTEGVLLQGRNVIDAGEGDTATVIGAIGDKQAAGGVYIAHDDLQSYEIITMFDARGVTVTTDNGLNDLGLLVDAANFVPAATKGEVIR